MQIFYDGLTQTCQSTVDNAAGGALKKKNAQESYNIYEMLGSNAQHKDTRGKRVGMYEISSNNDLALQVASLEKKLDSMLNMVPKIAEVCAIRNIPGHPTYQCSASEAYPEFVQEQVNLMNSYNRGRGMTRSLIHITPVGEIIPISHGRITINFKISNQSLPLRLKILVKMLARTPFNSSKLPIVLSNNIQLL
ncbi:unnamed protein product [Prunus brigantina]